MKTITTITLALILCSAASVACAQQVKSIRGTDAASPDQAPQQKTYSGDTPGGNALVLRTIKGQPPLIPHSIANLDITRTDNDCLGCHISDEFNGKKMPRVAASHLVPGKKTADGEPVLDMRRWQCNSCHVPQVDAKPLVENTYSGVAAAPKK